MKFGNWIPMSKAFVKELPTDRPFSKVEAAFSLQVDFDKGNAVTVAGYAKRWNWSRKKVSTFLEEIGISIEYPENTAKKQNQQGQIRVQIQNRSRSDRDQIKFINNSELPLNKNRTGTEKEQIGNRSSDTTKDTVIPDTGSFRNPPVVPLNGNENGTRNRSAASTISSPPLINPGFSQEFIAEHWNRWLRLKKGGNYKNAEAESIALEALFELSEGDETIAAQALKTAIAGHGQSFLWCFNQKNHQLTSPHVANQHHQNSPQESGLQFGADNLRWLELHARTEREEIGPELQ